MTQSLEGVTCAVCGLALTEPPTVCVNVLIGAASSVPSLMKPAHQACVPSPFIASPPSPDRTQRQEPTFGTDADFDPVIKAYVEHRIRFSVNPLDPAKNAVPPLIIDSWRFGFYREPDGALYFGNMDSGPFVAYAAITTAHVAAQCEPVAIDPDSAVYQEAFCDGILEGRFLERSDRDAECAQCGHPVAAQADALAALRQLVAVLDLKADLDEMSADSMQVGGLRQQYHERSKPAWAEARRVIAATGEKG